MLTLRIVVGAVAAIAALCSGICWVLAAKAKVLAATPNLGVGFGGTPVNVPQGSRPPHSLLLCLAESRKGNRP